jgi:hypothetical protein
MHYLVTYSFIAATKNKKLSDTGKARLSALGLSPLGVNYRCMVLHYKSINSGKSKCELRGLSQL